MSHTWTLIAVSYMYELMDVVHWKCSRYVRQSRRHHCQSEFALPIIMHGHKGRLLKHHCWVWSCAHCYQEGCFGAFCMLPACSCWNEGRSRVLTIQPFCTISSHLSLYSLYRQSVKAVQSSHSSSPVKCTNVERSTTSVRAAPTDPAALFTEWAKGD